MAQRCCRSCGCTELAPCITEYQDGYLTTCSWVEADLCSECARNKFGQFFTIDSAHVIEAFPTRDKLLASVRLKRSAMQEVRSAMWEQDGPPPFPDPAFQVSLES